MAAADWTTRQAPPAYGHPTATGPGALVAVRRDAQVATAVQLLELAAQHLTGTASARAAAEAARCVAVGWRIAAQMLATGSPRDADHHRRAAVHYLQQAHGLVAVRIQSADHPHAAQVLADIDGRLAHAADLLDGVDRDVLALTGQRVAAVCDTPPPGALPRWVLPAGGALVAAVLAVVIALVLGHRASDPTPGGWTTQPIPHAITWSTR